MVKFRFSPSRILTGAVAAAALTAFAAGAYAQTAQPGSPGQQGGMMMQDRAMQQRMQQQGMTQSDTMLRQQQMRGRMQQAQQQPQMGARPGAVGDSSSLQGRVQMWDMDRYIQMHQAVSAHQNCRSALSAPAMSAIVKQIESQTGEPPSAGRKLAIQDDAQFHMKEIIRVEGCADPRVKAALQAFDQTLAPAAHGNVAVAPR
ncbi:MAG: hypothetical protein VR70_13535 [Rhodospirillaceae bacterium BRH_c57]|nr:MAG: hypothetical protein VR70_13535 [Rhodospirillaceae bacterium BRH_c57]